MTKKQIFTIIASLVISTSSAQDSMNVNLLFQWNDITLPLSSVHKNRYNEIWGVAINGREYAIIGSTIGTHIFDVTDPNNVDTAAFVPGAVQSSLIIHRDYHDYNGYLYIVADEGSSTLQIADLNYLPDSVVVVYDSDTLFSKSHNIFIDTATAKLYVCGGGGNQLSVYSLADPVNPVLLVNCGTDVPFWASIGYIHDIYVRNDTAYCNAYNASGLFVVDFANTLNPQLLGSYMDNGQNHAGWLSENGKIYAKEREQFGEDVQLYDVSDLTNINVLSQLNSGVDANSIAHNLIIKDSFLFISYYNDGLYIFNISDPSNPFVSGYYDTSTEPHVQGKFRGAWGVYPLLPSGIVLISDMQNGLFVFDVSDALVATQLIKEKGQGYNTVSVYPNPFSEKITISLPDNFNSDLTLELFDMLGRTTLSEKQLPSNSNKYIIKTDDLPEGVYILEVRSKEIIHHKKIIKAVTDQ